MPDDKGTILQRYRKADGAQLTVTDKGYILRKRAGGKRFTVMSRVLSGVEKAKSHADAIAAAHGYEVES